MNRISPFIKRLIPRRETRPIVMMGYTLLHCIVVLILCPFAPGLKLLTDYIFPHRIAATVGGGEIYTVFVVYCAFCFATVTPISLCAAVDIIEELQHHLRTMSQEMVVSSSFYSLHVGMLQDFLCFVSSVILLCSSFLTVTRVGAFLHLNQTVIIIHLVETFTVVWLIVMWCIYEIGRVCLQSLFAMFHELRTELSKIVRLRYEMVRRKRTSALNKVFTLSSLEFEILGAFWEIGRQAGRNEAAERAVYNLNDRGENAPPEVLVAQAFRALVRKGLLEVKQGHHKRHPYYIPTISREEVAARLLNNISVKLLGRPLVGLLVMLLGQARPGKLKLTSEDERILYDLLKALKKVADQSEDKPNQ